MAKQKVENILVKAIRKEVVNITIAAEKGSSLIQKQFSEKTRGEIEKKQIGKEEINKKAPRDPFEEYKASMYWLDKNGNEYQPTSKDDPNKHKYGFGIPSRCFKAAVVTACTSCDIPKTLAKQAIQIMGDMIPIKDSNGKFAKPNKRNDIGRLQGKTSTPIYRGEFVDWQATITVQYNGDIFSADKVCNLINLAGFAAGLLEWRPSSPNKSGNHGMFHVLRS